MDTSKVLGCAMGLAAALIGAGWQVVTRQATSAGTLAPLDLALLRYGIPALLLLPIACRRGPWPRDVPPRLLLVMGLGAGLPFGLLAMSGSRFAPAAHMGVMMAAASPLLAAAFAALLWRERPGGARLLGLALMLAGVLLLGTRSLLDWQAGTWRGDALFFAAAALWAGYTLAFKRSGLSPWRAAALVNLWSLLLLMPLLAWRGAGALVHAPVAVLLQHALWQGLLAGVFGLWTFSVAIQRLGAANAAAFGALVPVLSALGGWWWLGDMLGPLDIAALPATTIGVLLAAGVFGASSATVSRRP